jgi:CRP/FNR family transcriptional regulator, anaerobic regulatory protein
MTETSAHEWIRHSSVFQQLEPEAQNLLAPVGSLHAPKGTVLFQPGDAVKGFVLLLKGQVGVYLCGRGGRDILLYDVKPGQTCVQSTLGLLGGEAYSAEALCETDCELVLLPGPLFTSLIDRSPAFRGYVFGAFAARMQNMMHLLEQVAFVRIEARLAAALLERADAGGLVVATHQELATMIGSAREVVSRRLETLSRRGLLRLERGSVSIADRKGLRALATNT